MTKASDNVFPKVIASEGAAPATPAANTVVLYAKADGLLYSKDDAGLETVVTGGGAAGATYGQVYAYPTTFTGDNDAMTATTNWADVTAFDIKEILNSTILHLKTLGASKDQRVRFTLGTTKAAAFDFRFHGMALDASYWSADLDVYAEVVLATSGGTIVAIARLYPRATGTGTIVGETSLRVGTTAVVTTNFQAALSATSPFDLRIARDGSNVLSFGIGSGTAPAALWRPRVTADNTDYAPTSSGTIARVELSIHTPAGPGATVSHHLYCDAFVSA